MKTNVLNLTIILTLLCNVSIGQNNISTDFDINYLIGTWKNINEFADPNVNLTYVKASSLEKNHTGFILKFKSDGEMITRLLLGDPTKCGNDYTQNPRIGNWSFNKKTNILITTTGKWDSSKYQILELTRNKLIMKRIITK